MITKPTVFVLGAGASCPYGFPTGDALLGDVIAICRTPQFSHDFGPTEIRIGTGDLIPLRDFADDLQRSRHQSIDAFLRDRPEYREAGTKAIAATLLPREHQARLMGIAISDCLYTQLADLLAPGRGSPYSDNNASFITYNYDRSLEQFLLTSVQRRFGYEEEQAIDALHGLKIVHVHGALGAHRLYEDEDRALPYDGNPGQLPSKLQYESVANHLKLIFEEEEIQASSALRDARELIKGASQVIFLGFGYDDDNLSRLFQVEKGSSILQAHSGKLFYGSSLNMTGRSINDLERKFQFSSNSHTAIKLKAKVCRVALDELLIDFQNP